MPTIRFLVSAILAALVLLVVASLVPTHCDAPAPKGAVPRILSQGPTIERIERLAHLVSMRVYVADVLTAEGEGYRGAWLVKGDGLIGVDLSRAQITTKNLDTREATVQLPRPAVVLSRVDHAHTKTWEVQRTTWVPWRGNEDRLRDAVMLHAQRLVAHASESEENLERARLGTETVIRSLYEEFGWKVAVRWDPSSPAVNAHFELTHFRSSGIDPGGVNWEGWVSGGACWSVRKKLLSWDRSGVVDPLGVFLLVGSFRLEC